MRGIAQVDRAQVEALVRNRCYTPPHAPPSPYLGPLTGQLQYPGHGYPPRPGEDRPMLSPWGRLTFNQPLGKKTVVVYNEDDTGKQSSPVTILQVQGDDADAQPAVLTLAPPLVVPLAYSSLLATAQNVSGEQNNYQIANRGNFPGSLTPVRWPLLQAIVEWGTGGAQAQAQVDFVNGTTVNLTGSYFRVHAVVPRGAGTGIAGTSAAYVLYAFLSLGYTRPGIAQRTVYVGEVDSLAESAVFPVPRFADTAYVVGQDPAASPAVTVVTLRFWQSADGVTGGDNVGNFLITGNQPGRFPVPGCAAYASVQNGMGLATRFSIVYNLAI